MEPRFSLTLGTWAIYPSGKKFGPYLKVRPSNPVSESYIWWEISAHESLWNASKPCFPKINAMKEYDFGSLSILTEWLRQVEALMVLAKTMTNIAILCNKRKWRFVQVFPFSWRSQKKGENSKVERVISSKCVVRVHEGQLCAQE